MRRRFLAAFSLALALASAAFAQADGGEWVLVAPEGEEFAVRMPRPPVRVRRMLPLSDERNLVPPSYEAEGDAVRYSVLSFEKSAGKPDTLDKMTEGLRHAFLGAENGDYLIEHERDLTLDGRAGKEFTLRTGKPLGTVRVYDAARHFYVLVSFGGRAGEPEVDRFFSSFTLDPQARDAASAHRQVKGPGTSGPPASFWGVLPEMKSVGVVIGDRGANPPGPQDAKIVRGGVLNGKVVSSAAPEYPEIAKAARATGTVVVQIVIDEEGRVISASAVSGHPLLQQAAVAAVRQWRFSPTHLSGQPVKVAGVVNVNFVLQ